MNENVVSFICHSSSYILCNLLGLWLFFNSNFLTVPGGFFNRLFIFVIYFAFVSIVVGTILEKVIFPQLIKKLRPKKRSNNEIHE